MAIFFSLLKILQNDIRFRQFCFYDIEVSFKTNLSCDININYRQTLITLLYTVLLVTVIISSCSRANNGCNISDTLGLWLGIIMNLGRLLPTEILRFLILASVCSLKLMMSNPIPIPPLCSGINILLQSLTSTLTCTLFPYNNLSRLPHWPFSTKLLKQNGNLFFI